MDIKELKELLNNSSDKLSIFANKTILAKYEFSLSELKGLINDFLDDEQKKKLFDFEHFLKLSSGVKKDIINSISDDNIKLNLISNSEVMSEISEYDILDIITSLKDDGKIYMLHKVDFFSKYDIRDYQIGKLIVSLDDEKREELLLDKNLIKEGLKLDNYHIKDIITKFKDEKIKLQMISDYEFEKYDMIDVIKTFSDESKKKILEENKYEFDSRYLKEIISSLSVDSLLEFYNNSKDYFEKNNIELYEITRVLSKEKQLELVSKFDNTDMTLDEKRKILATLKKETKKDIDTSKFSPEYVTAIKMEIGDKIGEIDRFGKIVVDLDENLEIYKGLDKLIYMNPMSVSSEYKQKLLSLCKICPKINMSDNIGLSPSTAQEYREAEIWIETVLQGIDENYTDIQKVAYIDNQIGKKISYSPDFDTEVQNMSDARALWKIINSGYGVCNGIAQVEKYIFDKVGIESEMISTGRHAFLKLKNIELTNENKEKVVGDTVLDPTWNLAAHRYGARPNNFCQSYEQIRKNDIKSDGTDSMCHKNDEDLSSATLGLDDKSLREVFSSIGLADKNGDFPIKELIEKSNAIDKLDLSDEEELKRQLLLLEDYYPLFANCQNSTINILQGTVLAQENLKFKNCVASRVYEKEDKDKRPVMYVYADLLESGKKFYYADKETGQFTELSQKDFEQKFECYGMDLEKEKGNRPWEIEKIEKEVEDLSRSSGKVIAEEREER